MGGKFIIDTDIGIDDAFALRLGVLDGEMMGVTTTYGNAPLEKTVVNAKLALRLWNCSLPVYRGASRPLCGKAPVSDGQIHGQDGFGDVYDHPDSPAAPDAISAIIEAARREPGTITLITIGPLTNLALALNLEPALPQLLREVIVMGGAFGTNGNSGNMTRFAEFNIYCDPEAADAVFAAPFHLTVVPLDITQRVRVSREEVAAYGDEVLQRISAVYFDYYTKIKEFGGICVHDALTMVYRSHPELFDVVKARLTVSTAGLTRGQTLMASGDSHSFDHDVLAGRPVHQVILGGQIIAIRETLHQMLTAPVAGS